MFCLPWVNICGHFVYGGAGLVKKEKRKVNATQSQQLSFFGRETVFLLPLLWAEASEGQIGVCPRLFQPPVSLQKRKKKKTQACVNIPPQNECFMMTHATHPFSLPAFTLYTYIQSSLLSHYLLEKTGGGGGRLLCPHKRDRSTITIVQSTGRLKKY